MNENSLNSFRSHFSKILGVWIVF